MNPEEHREKWDVVSLSLVLNFPPNPTDRGESYLCVSRVEYVVEVPSHREDAPLGPQHAMLGRPVIHCSTPCRCTPRTPILIISIAPATLRLELTVHDA